MSKKSINLLILISAMVILSNIFSVYVNAFTDGMMKSYLFQTEKAEFEFWTMPSKGRDIEMMEGHFASFKDAHQEHSNLKLYRTFKRNPLKFWNWYTYLTNERYDYEYQEEIKK